MTEDTYTHRPGDVDENRGGRASDESEGLADPAATTDDATTAGPAITDPAAPVERGREEWNYRDWVLVGVIVLCFLVIPAAILLLPPVRPFRFAYLVLPLLPAILLGATAVWSAQRSE